MPITKLMAVAAVPGLMGGNIVNVISGGIASYLGYQAAPAAQQRGAQFLGVATCSWASWPRPA